MQLRYLNNLIILSDHHFIDRFINNLGIIGHHGPIVHTRVSLIKIIDLTLTGFRSYWIDVDCRERDMDLSSRPAETRHCIKAF